jgi:hypothetical protein
MPTRRMVLKYGFIGAGILAAGGIGLSLQNTKMIVPNSKLSVLSDTEFSILHAICERLLPQNGLFPAASELNIAEKIDTVLYKADEFVQSEIKQVLLLVENALLGTLFDGHYKTFTQSSPEKQDQLLLSWQHSSLSLRRSALKALNSLCGAAYYANSETHALIGYDGPPKHLIAIVNAAGEH